MHRLIRPVLSLALALGGIALAVPATAAPTLTVTPSNLPIAVGGAPYNVVLQTTGGTAPYSYAFASGALPPGTAFSSSGKFLGTPSVAGTYPLGIRVTDNTGAFVTKSYTLTVVAPTIVITPATVPKAVVGLPYRQVLSSSGSSGYTYSLAAGALPVGFSFTSSGVLAGTATTPGNYSLTIRSTDAYGFYGLRSYTIEVRYPPPTLTSGIPSRPALAARYRHVLAVDGTTAPYRFARVLGSLPPGLTLSADGVISGTPTMPGDFLAVVETTSMSAPTAPLVILLDLPVAPRLTARLSARRTAPGRMLRVSGAGLLPGTSVPVTLDGTKRLGTAIVTTDGTFSLRVQVPRRTRTGAHRVVVRAAGSAVRLPLRVAR